jgi:dephospho-CoA kinase
MGRERRRAQTERTVVVVGLTGSIGAGKSTALALFEECGAAVVSADRLVHQLYSRPDVTTMVAEHFGSKVLDSSGKVDRAELALAVRRQPGELHWLEELTHPLVAEEIAQLVESAPVGTVVVCEVPLLFESGFEGLFDVIVTVEAGAEVRRQRSIHQFGLEQFAEFESLQATRERRVEGSDLAFVNDGDLDELREFVRGAYVAAKQLLDSGQSGERP